jgi:predicted DCC family thiol-disulfide oxidoreductase YuxK
MVETSYNSYRNPVPITGVPDGIVLYDGVCVLCSALFRFVVARDPQARFRFTATQDAYGRWLALKLGIDPDNPRANAVVLEGKAYLGADAALAIMGSLPGWSLAAALVGMVPSGLRRWAYDQIARHRYRLFGRMDTCLVPGPALTRHLYAGLPPSE